MKIKIVVPLLYHILLLFASLNLKGSENYASAEWIWGVRKTIGWEIDETSGKTKQKYQIIGYFATRQEALKALAAYNENPYSISNKITFAELYDKWSEEKFESISDSNIKGYRASYKACTSLYKMKFADIRKVHLQHVVDSCGKNYPTLRKLKVLFNQLFRYAMENDIIQKDYSQYVDIAKHKENKRNTNRLQMRKFAYSGIM